MGTGIKQPRGVGTDSVGKEELKEPAVDTAYLVDNSVTSAKVGSSVDLEFVRSNDNTIAGGINAKVDGAYNLGSSTNQFDTVYANNFPGAGGATLSTKSANITGQGVQFIVSKSDSIYHLSAEVPKGVRVRQYSNPLLSQLSNESKGTSAIGGAITPGGDEVFTVSKYPDGTDVSSFSAGGDVPSGLTWDGSYLWNVTAVSNDVYKYTKEGIQKGTFKVDGAYPWGITWDGTYLGIVDRDSHTVYKYKKDGTRITGEEFTASPPSGGQFRGIAWNGMYYWMTHISTDTIYEFDNAGNQLSAKNTPTAILGSTTWDGKNFMYQGPADYVYVISPDDPSTIIDRFKVIGLEEQEGAWDGIYLWSVDDIIDIVYQYGNSGFNINYRMTWIS